MVDLDLLNALVDAQAVVFVYDIVAGGKVGQLADLSALFAAVFAPPSPPGLPCRAEHIKFGQDDHAIVRIGDACGKSAG